MGTSVKGTTGAEFVLYGNECERKKQGQSLYYLGTSVKGTNRGRVCVALYCMGTITKKANRGRICIVLHCMSIEFVLYLQKEQTKAEFVLYGNECERNKHGQSLYCTVWERV